MELLLRINRQGTMASDKLFEKMSLKINLFLISLFILSINCNDSEDGWSSFKRRHGKSYRSGEERIRYQKTRFVKCPL